MPARYDFGRYVNSNSTFAVRFYYYSMVLYEGEMIPSQMLVLTVTLQEAGCK